MSSSSTVPLEVVSRGRAVRAISRAVEQEGGVVTALAVTSSVAVADAATRVSGR